MSSLGRPPAAWAPHTGTRCWPRCAGPCPCGTPFGETSSRQNGPGWAPSCPGPGPSSAPMPLPSPAGATNAGVPHRSPHEPSWSFRPDCSGGAGLAGCLGTQGFLPQRASWGWATTQERQPGTGPSCSHFEIPNRPLPWPGALGLGLSTPHPCWEASAKLGHVREMGESWGPGAVLDTSRHDMKRTRPLGCPEDKTPLPWGSAQC